MALCPQSLHPGDQPALPGPQPLRESERDFAPCAPATRFPKPCGFIPSGRDSKHFFYCPDLAGSSESDKNSPVFIRNAPSLTSHFSDSTFGGGTRDSLFQLCRDPRLDCGGSPFQLARSAPSPRPAPRSCPRAVCSVYLDKAPSGRDPAKRRTPPGNRGRSWASSKFPFSSLLRAPLPPARPAHLPCICAPRG